MNFEWKFLNKFGTEYNYGTCAHYFVTKLQASTLAEQSSSGTFFLETEQPKEKWITSAQEKNILPPSRWRMWVRLWPEGVPRLDSGPEGRKKGKLSFIHDGHCPRLHRCTKWAHSKRNAARATTGAWGRSKTAAIKWASGIVPGWHASRKKFKRSMPS